MGGWHGGRGGPSIRWQGGDMGGGGGLQDPKKRWCNLWTAPNNIYPCVLTMLPYMACYLETVLINWHSTNWRHLHRQQYLPLCSDHALIHGILFGDITHQLVIPPRGSENKFLFLETPEHSMVLRYRIELGQLYTPPYLVVRLKCYTQTPIYALLCHRGTVYIMTT